MRILRIPVKKAVDTASEFLKRNNIQNPRLEARLLVASATERSVSAIISSPEYLVDVKENQKITEVTSRRCGGEPLAYILGEKEFWSLKFEVDSNTLIPRPETETLIEGILSNFNSYNTSFCILDLGTGTGCILAALLTEFKDSIGVCLDKSLLTCKMAQRNLSNLGLANRSSILVDNWGASLTGAYKIICCNPPYVSTSEILNIDQEIRGFEPIIAIDGGLDGLDCYRSIAPIISHLLCPHEGIAALEIGYNQADAVSKILFSNNLKVIDLKQDLAGIDRCLLATVAENDSL